MDKRQYILTKLAEEAAEVAQIALKAAQFGFNTRHPVSGKSNRKLLKNEIRDFFAYLRMLEENTDFRFDVTEEEIHARKLKAGITAANAVDSGNVTWS